MTVEQEALLAVEQIDRDAAADYIEPFSGRNTGAKLRSGRSDHTGIVQTLARHRISALSREGEEGWQDIAAAPKDGERFLVCDAAGGLDFARWHRDHVCGESDGASPFTHWHPLLEPPLTTNKGGSRG